MIIPTLIIGLVAVEIRLRVTAIRRHGRLSVARLRITGLCIIWLSITGIAHGGTSSITTLIIAAALRLTIASAVWLRGKSLRTGKRRQIHLLTGFINIPALSARTGINCHPVSFYTDARQRYSLPVGCNEELCTIAAPHHMIDAHGHIIGGNRLGLPLVLLLGHCWNRCGQAEDRETQAEGKDLDMLAHHGRLLFTRQLQLCKKTTIRPESMAGQAHRPWHVFPATALESTH